MSIKCPSGHPRDPLISEIQPETSRHSLASMPWCENAGRFPAAWHAMTCHDMPWYAMICHVCCCSLFLRIVVVFNTQAISRPTLILGRIELEQVDVLHHFWGSPLCSMATRSAKTGMANKVFGCSGKSATKRAVPRLTTEKRFASPLQTQGTQGRRAPLQRWPQSSRWGRSNDDDNNNENGDGEWQIVKTILIRGQRVKVMKMQMVMRMPGRSWTEMLTNSST